MQFSRAWSTYTEIHWTEEAEGNQQFGVLRCVKSRVLCILFTYDKRRAERGSQRVVRVMQPGKLGSSTHNSGISAACTSETTSTRERSIMLSPPLSNVPAYGYCVPETPGADLGRRGGLSTLSQAEKVPPVSFAH